MHQKKEDMFLLCYVMLLSLFSMSQSAPLSCEDRLRPLDPRYTGQLWGVWALVAGSLDHPPSMDALSTRDSITMMFTPGLGGGDVNTAANYLQINRFGASCHFLPYNISLGSDGTFTFLTGGHFNLTGVFLSVASCPDCVAMRWDVASRRRISRDLYLLSRGRREVGEEIMEEFRAQLRCLGLLAPVVMDPTKNLCQEENHGPN